MPGAHRKRADLTAVGRAESTRGKSCADAIVGVPQDRLARRRSRVPGPCRTRHNSGPWTDRSDRRTRRDPRRLPRLTGPRRDGTWRAEGERVPESARTAQIRAAEPVAHDGSVATLGQIARDMNLAHKAETERPGGGHGGWWPLAERPPGHAVPGRRCRGGHHHGGGRRQRAEQLPRAGHRPADGPYRPAPPPSGPDGPVDRTGLRPAALHDEHPPAHLRHHPARRPPRRHRTRDLRAGLHAAEAAQFAGHPGGRRARGAAPADRLDRGDGERRCRRTDPLRPSLRLADPPLPRHRASTGSPSTSARASSSSPRNTAPRPPDARSCSTAWRSPRFPCSS